MALQLTPEIEQEILRLIRQTRSPFKAAKKAGVDIQIVFDLIAQNKEQLQAAQERYGGIGRPELEPFLVARRKVTERTSWNNNEAKIAEARINYELGTHILTTGRDGGWLLLYSIPRQGKPDPKPDYFRPEVA